MKVKSTSLFYKAEGWKEYKVCRGRKGFKQKYINKIPLNNERVLPFLGIHKKYVLGNINLQ